MKSESLFIDIFYFRNNAEKSELKYPQFYAYQGLNDLNEASAPLLIPPPT
jgi:hypothetical protein